MYQKLTKPQQGLQMPPAGPLSADQIETIGAWIDQGADWPDAFAGEAPPQTADAQATRLMEALRNGDSKALEVPLSMTPDGRTLVYLKFGATTGPDLWTVPFETANGEPHAGKPEPFQASLASESQARFSPDGQRIAFNSTASGSWEIYVQSFPPRSPPVMVSVGGGRIPMWSAKKNELFYATERQRIMKVSYTIRDGVFVPSRPVIWTERSFADTGVVPALDLDPDGKRFAALMPAELPGQQQSPNHATILLNFLDEVGRRVAAQK